MRKTLTREIEACRRELAMLRSHDPYQDDMEIDDLNNDPTDNLRRMTIHDPPRRTTRPIAPGGINGEPDFDDLDVAHIISQRRGRPSHTQDNNAFDPGFTPAERVRRAQEFLPALRARIQKTGCTWFQRADSKWELGSVDRTTWFAHTYFDDIQYTAGISYLTPGRDIPNQQQNQSTPDRITLWSENVDSASDLERVIGQVNHALAHVPMAGGRPNRQHG